MKIGIVGSEGAKFTEQGREKAEEILYSIIGQPDVTHVISGGCHLGGIDIWAEDIAILIGKVPEIYFPKELSWANGYKPRNLQIAKNSDIVYVLSVDKLPPDYKGMTFNECYHCKKAGRNALDHIKSGGCWTAVEAMKLGKDAKWFIVRN